MSTPHDAPILEFDSDREAILNPSKIFRSAVPDHAVICFFQDVIETLVEQHNAHLLGQLRSEIGRHSIYQVTFANKPMAVFHPGVGAPLAVGLLEEVIAQGCTKFIACGGAGVLDGTLGVGHIVVPNAAIRDEGTSYHYLPASREVAANPQAVAAIVETLQAHELPYVVGKTWTTDAFYRETRAKLQQRLAEGCLTVDMEASAFFAVAEFRGVTLGQVLYGGDDLSGSEWDSRDWTRHSIRETLFWLAAEACLKL